MVLDSGIYANVPFNVSPVNIVTNSETIFKTKDTDKELIESIVLRELKVLLSTPSYRDFSFLKSVKMYIDADSLEEVLMASLYDFPDEIGKELILDPVDLDLKEFLMKDSFSVRMEAITDTLIDIDHTLRSYYSFIVGAKTLEN